MRKISLAIITLALLLAPVLSAAQEVNVTGDWELTIESPRGTRTQNVHFEQTGDKLVVTMEGRRGGEVTGEGTISGNEIEWSITRSFRGNSFTMTYQGTVEGDSMKGEVEMGGRGTMEWTAKKKS